MNEGVNVSDQDPWEGRRFLERLTALQQRLRNVHYLDALSDATHSESEAVALGVLDIQKAASEIHAMVNELVEEGNDDRIRGLLTDIGDAYREIDWHMREMRYFSYIFDDETTRPSNTDGSDPL